jgi:sirohydrochlorin ferrochelatase
METDALVLLARETPHGRTVARTHADRLRERLSVDEVHTAFHDGDPQQDLDLESVTAEEVYAVPLCIGHTYATTEDYPAALASLPGTVSCSGPVGDTATVTEALFDRAREAVPDPETIVLVGLGHSQLDAARSAVEQHATRLREHTDVAVETCYLLQNPTVECVRYSISDTPAVAVPAFIADCPATREEIPRKLELDRGGLAYADPVGDHPALTAAIHADVEKQRVLSEADAHPGAGESLQPVATDGLGQPPAGTDQNTVR